MAEQFIGRWLYEEERLNPGYLRVLDGIVEEICRGSPPAGSTCSVVLPAFVNAHTHLGDSFAHPAPRGTVKSVVGPGGYKHQMLSSAPADVKLVGMRASIDHMLRTGTTLFADFREEGREGVEAIKYALADRPVRGIVLGRPPASEDAGEASIRLLEFCDGLAFSAVSDWPLDVLASASESCRRSRKLFSLHVSEAEREPIEDVLDLKPNFIVHMTAAPEEDIASCAEAGVPIVVCPRANAFFGLYPNIPRFLSTGATVALGTDNAMICRPDMLSELRAAYALSLQHGGISPADAISLATLSGRKVLNAEGQITTEMSVSDDLIVVDVEGEDPLLELVSSAAKGSVSAVAQRGRLRRPSFG
ncbi:MAG: amidohydrolase family protein [Methanobacteriota archaeon]|nr:MAG: amidohydrolase family protein [Euryarchaeota archaeon]